MTQEDPFVFFPFLDLGPAARDLEADEQMTEIEVSADSSDTALTEECGIADLKEGRIHVVGRVLRLSDLLDYRYNNPRRGAEERILGDATGTGADAFQGRAREVSALDGWGPFGQGRIVAMGNRISVFLVMSPASGVLDYCRQEAVGKGWGLVDWKVRRDIMSEGYRLAIAGSRG